MSTAMVVDRYSCAVQSSDLRVTLRGGDVDALIAAGWVREGLATLLYRLRAEFDVVKAECRMAENRVAAAMAVAITAAKAAVDARFETERGPTQVKPLEDRALELMVAYQRAATTERVLLSVKLKSLARAHRALHSFIVVRARYELKVQLPPHVVEAVTGQVLEGFLDGICLHCKGRRFVFPEATPWAMGTTCPACDGTGLRKQRLDDVKLMDAIMLALERKMDRVDGLMRRYKSRGRPGLPDGSRWRVSDGSRYMERTADGVHWSRVN